MRRKENTFWGMLDWAGEASRSAQMVSTLTENKGDGAEYGVNSDASRADMGTEKTLQFGVVG
jgi:hypothetical protein